MKNSLGKGNSKFKVKPVLWIALHYGLSIQYTLSFYPRVLMATICSFPVYAWHLDFLISKLIV